MITWIVSAVSFCLGVVVGVIAVAVVTAFSEGMVPAKLSRLFRSSGDG